MKYSSDQNTAGKKEKKSSKPVKRPMQIQIEDFEESKPLKEKQGQNRRSKESIKNDIDKRNDAIMFLFVACLFLVIAIAALVYIRWEDNTHDALEQVNIDLKDEVISGRYIEIKKDSGIEMPDDTEYLRDINWDKLMEINEDIIGWIYIPKTNIDYPILQEPEEGKSFYLDHDYAKRYNVNGSILTHKLPEDREDAHIVLFGHHMMDQTFMFSSLNKYYKNAESAEKYKYCYIYKYNKETKVCVAQKWEIWMTDNISNYDDVFRTPYEIASDEYDALIKHMVSGANFVTKTEMTKDDKMLVLATCDQRTRESRFYAAFKLFDEYIQPGASLRR